MKTQILYLQPYDWYVYVYYDTMPKDTDEVLDRLYELGCSKYNLQKTRSMLIEGSKNIGLTYSNPNRRESVLVLGSASSLREFLNTFQHEITHLGRHICQEFNIDPYSEEAAYLAGDIAQQMHPTLSLFTCHCGCRDEQFKEE